MSVGLPEDKLEMYFDRLRKERGELKVEIGCFNSENNLTVTGSLVQIELLHLWLRAESVFARKLRVSIAYHSSYMKRVAEAYFLSLGPLEPGVPSKNDVSMISTVTGDPVSKEELCRPRYWIQNMVSPVKFAQALSALLNTPGKQRKQLGSTTGSPYQITDLMELGPHSALRGPVQETIRLCHKETIVQYAPTIVRNIPDVESILASAGRLFCSGYPVNLLAANRLSNSSRQLKHDLPRYPFNHNHSYWLESRISNNYRFRKHGRHDLLGVPSSNWNPLQAQWRHFIGLDELPWTKDHQVSHLILYSGNLLIK